MQLKAAWAPLQKKLVKLSQKIYGRPPGKRRKKKTFDPLVPDPATIPEAYKTVSEAEKQRIFSEVDWDELVADLLIELNKFTQPAATTLQKYVRRMCSLQIIARKKREEAERQEILRKKRERAAALERVRLTIQAEERWRAKEAEGAPPRENLWLFAPQEEVKRTVEAYEGWAKDNSLDKPVKAGFFEGELLDALGVQKVKDLPTLPDLMLRLCVSLNLAGSLGIAKAIKAAKGNPRQIAVAVSKIEGDKLSG